jgi:hypothetical protein
MTPRIPNKVRLAPGRVVAVKYINQDLIDVQMAEKGHAGFWDHTCDTIFISKRVSKVRKWKVFRHELAHSIIDIHESENGGV